MVIIRRSDWLFVACDRLLKLLGADVMIRTTQIWKE